MYLGGDVKRHGCNMLFSAHHTLMRRALISLTKLAQWSGTSSPLKDSHLPDGLISFRQRGRRKKKGEKNRLQHSRDMSVYVYLRASVCVDMRAKMLL